MANAEDTVAMEEELIAAVSVTKQEAVPMKAVSAEKMKSEGDWVKANIKKRVCTRYVRSTKQLPNFGPDVKYTDLGETCECGYTLMEHTETQSCVGDARLLGSRDNDEWNAAIDTEAQATDAHGELDFIDSSKKVAKYVRIEEQTDPETLKHLLFNVWKLDKPTLAISVIGGASITQAKPKVVQAVRRGLVKVVRSGAWLITNGARQGVTRIVGDAAGSTMSDTAKTVCLGILPWGVVANREQLLTNNPRLPARYTISERPQTRGLSLPLDPNHTHFLLVDNGTARLYGTEIIMRGRVEELLRTMPQTDSNKTLPSENTALDIDKLANGNDLVTTATNSMQIPLCCVMFGGGLPTFETMHHSLKTGTPVVIVKGYGRIADLVAFTIEQLKVDDSEDEGAEAPNKQENEEIIDIASKYEEGTEEEMAKFLKDEVDKAEDIAVYTKKILSTVFEFSELLHVFDVEEKNKTLDLAVLLAILRGNKSDDVESSKLNQLGLALQWNRPDIATTEILSSDFKLRTGQVTDLFTKAIAQNKAQFAKLMIDQGFNLYDYLTKDVLTLLYNQGGDSPFLLLVSKEMQRKKNATSVRKRNSATLSEVGRAITNLCGGMYFSVYQHDPAKCSATYSVMFINDMDHVLYTEQKLERKNAAGSVENAKTADYNFGDPAMHLFFLAVLFNRKDLAMLFWNDLTQKLAAAQMASFLLDKLVPYATDRDVRQSIQDNATYFDALAVGVLDGCYSADQNLTHLLILREIREFADTTCIDLANCSANMPFIAHTACQTLLNDVWTGEIYEAQNIFVILLCLICPPLIPCLIRFHSKEPPKIVTTIAPPKLQSETSIEDEESCVRPPPPIPFNFCRPIQRILQFFVAPQITFLSNVVSYVIFLMMYTSMVLGNYVDDCESPMSSLETLLIIWVLCLFIEELRQLVNEPGTGRHKLALYISNPWNQLDVVSISCFLIAEMLSATRDVCITTLPYIRVIGGISIFIFYNRILQTFSANKHIGPKLVMIFRMFKDIVIIMTILVIIVIGYTVVVVSMLTPDQPMGFQRFSAGLSQVYWSMFGNLDIQTFGNITKIPLQYKDAAADDGLNSTDSNSTSNLNDTEYDPSSIPDPIGGYYLVTFLGVFVILTNLLLFNVLIAMFNYTFAVVQDKADEYWCYQRYKLITEYFARPPFPPPFLLIFHFWLVIQYIYAKLKARFTKSSSIVKFADNPDCKVKCDDSVERQLTTWEGLVVDEYMENVERKENETVENHVLEVHEQVSAMKDAVFCVENVVEDVSTNIAKLTKNEVVEKKLASLEDKVNALTDDMKKVLQALRVK